MIENNVTRVLKVVPKTDFQNCFGKWKLSWECVIQSNGNYFELCLSPDDKKLHHHRDMITGVRMEPKRLKRGNEEEYRFEAVLEQCLVGEVPELEVYISTITDRKKTSDIIMSLNRVCPLPSLQHLKRVCRDRVLLCRCEDSTLESVDTLLQQVGGADSLCDLRIVKVPAVAPRSAKQFRQCNQLWSCNFHRNDGLERLVSGECFSRDEIESKSKWMRMAVEYGRRCSGAGGGGAVVAVEDQLVAAACDGGNCHALRHAAMVAIDLVARSQGGGAWPLTPMDYYTQSPPSTDPCGPYLCSGYDIYLSVEPCIMCAMALVHSRIRRVFFLAANPRRGALVSLTRVQCLKPLNHHYQVFSAALLS